MVMGGWLMFINDDNFKLLEIALAGRRVAAAIEARISSPRIFHHPRESSATAEVNAF